MQVLKRSRVSLDTTRIEIRPMGVGVRRVVGFHGEGYCFAFQRQLILFHLVQPYCLATLPYSIQSNQQPQRWTAAGYWV